MTNGDVVAGGQQPTRHHQLVRLFLGAVLGVLAFALVFTSGYLIGTSETGQSSATAVKFRPQAREGLPAPADPARQVNGTQKNRSSAREHESKNPKQRFVTVEEGDSLWGIAATVAPHADPQAMIERILKLNSLHESAGLEIGQRLAVPGATKRRGHEHAKPGGASSPTAGVAPPVSVSIPRLGLHQDLVELNVIGGTLQVPTDYDDIGWWRDGPSPGAQGSAVLVGHVDSKTGPAVFYELSAVHIGDSVVIDRADGTTAKFRVSDATLYPRESFPSSSVYREHGRPTLSLVTCGGSYDVTAGHYTGNLVVTAHLADRNPR